MGAERAVAQLNAWLDRIHVSLNDDLVPYFMDGIKVFKPMVSSRASTARFRPFDAIRLGPVSSID